MKFNIGRIIARVQRKYGFKYKDVVSRYWDEDYSNARKTKIWRNSFQFCKINGIIEQQTKESDIPLLAKKMGINGTTGGFVKLTTADVETILHIAAKATV